MADISTTTEYSFSLNTTSQDGTMNQVSFALASQGDFTDDMAFAFRDAFLALDWPPTTQATASVQKIDVAGTSYDTDYSTNPPRFV